MSLARGVARSVAAALLLALSLAATKGCAAAAALPAAGTLYVSAAAPPTTGEAIRDDGSAANPYRSLQAAKEHILRQHARGGRRVIRRVQIGPGRYEPVSIDHAALSGVHWHGAGRNLTVVSGGILIPRQRFTPWANVSGVYVASIAGLGADSLGAMTSGNEVADCQHDKVGLSFDGEAMTLARWPNQAPAAQPADETSPWRWSRAHSGCTRSPGGSTFAVNIQDDPDALRLLQWNNEADAFVHGYWEWDWGDAYAPVSKIQRRGDTVELSYRDAPTCKPGARWMGVNILSELDAPREYWIDHEKLLVYFFPPEPPSGVEGPPIALMYQPGGVLNVSRDARNVTLSDMAVVNGRHAGILAAGGVVGLKIERVSVHAMGTHGIVLTGASGGSILDSNVHGVGCSGIRATAGVAATLQTGGLVVADNHVHHVAQWKRSYMPGIYWGGVRNTFRNNVVEYHPHACFVGGGDFEDGVENLFEGNTLSVCAFETLDAGAFYSSGQQGTAFTNRGNVLRGNTFSEILNHAFGTGVQQASVQAVYLDDQQSGWTVTQNLFTDCTVCSFIGGGRRNVISENRFVRCGTLQYLNDQGLTDPSLNGIQMINCSDVQPPFSTGCSTGAATWMTTKSPAAAAWLQQWPEMAHIRSDLPGSPAHSMLIDNVFCRNKSAAVHEIISSNVDPSCPDAGAGCVAVLTQWGFGLRNNTETFDC